MARRGDELREHILFSAKDVFLEMGFERASMDAVAARAATSRRSLYAHFESKECLFLQVIELVRGLFLGKLKMPAEYGANPTEALVQFCGRYLEILLFERAIQMCRITIAESARFPEGASQYFEVMFLEPQTRVAAYLRRIFGMTPKASAEAAQGLMGALLYPRLQRALLGIDTLAPGFDEQRLDPGFDLKPVRRAVAALIESIER